MAAAKVVGLSRWRTQTTLGPDEVLGTGAIVDAGQLEGLDDEGLIRVGRPVAGGDVLVAIARPKKSGDGLEAVLDAQLGALFGDELEDRSLCCPPWVRDGVVVALDFVDAERRVVEVVIETRRALRIGDAIEVAGSTSLINVADIVDALPNGADAAIPGFDGMHRVRYADCAEERCWGQSVGPIDPKTKQPLVGRGRAQQLASGHLSALLEAGARESLAEMLSLKSDDRDGAFQLYASLFGKERATPAFPPAAERLGHLLGRMGLHAHLEERPPWIELPNEWQRAHNAEALPVPLLHPFAIDAAAALLELPASTIERTLYAGRQLDGSAARGADQCGASAIAGALDRVDVHGLKSKVETARWLASSGESPSSLVFRSWPTIFLWEAETDAERERLLRAERFLEQREATAAVWRNVASNEAERIGAASALQRALGEMLLGEHSVGGLVHELPGLCLSKAVDFAGVANVVARPDIGPTEVRVPLALAREVLRPHVYARLEEQGTAKTIKDAAAFVRAGDPRVGPALHEVATGRAVLLLTEGKTSKLLARRMVLWAEDALGLHEVEASVRRAQLHVPMTDAAKEETAALVEGPLPTAWPPRGWLAEAAFGRSPTHTLLAAALSRDRLPMDDAYTLAFLGR